MYSFLTLLINYQNLKYIVFTETLQVCEQVVPIQEENGKMISKGIAQLMKDQLIIKGSNIFLSNFYVFYKNMRQLVWIPQFNI